MSASQLTFLHLEVRWWKRLLQVPSLRRSRARTYLAWDVGLSLCQITNILLQPRNDERVSYSPPRPELFTTIQISTILHCTVLSLPCFCQQRAPSTSSSTAAHIAGDQKTTLLQVQCTKYDTSELHAVLGSPGIAVVLSGVQRATIHFFRHSKV